jgi:hypothetical protein
VRSRLKFALVSQISEVCTEEENWEGAFDQMFSWVDQDSVKILTWGDDKRLVQVRKPSFSCVEIYQRPVSS